MTAMRWLFVRVIGGFIRLHPLRATVAVIAIALGVTLGYGVHLINSSALAEFEAAVRQVTGQADAAVIGPRDGFDDTVFDRLAVDPAVDLASPMLEVEAALVEPARLRGRTLTVLGIDLFSAARLAPQLIGRTAPATESDRSLGLLGDGLFLSPAALQGLQLAPGDEVGVQVGGHVQRLRIAGELPSARAGQKLATMDIGFAQWRFDRLGKLTRIDVQLAAGARIEQLAARHKLPAGVYFEGASQAETRASNLSRAYRVNLSALALVALFTGSFLVYSLQSQGVVARASQLAFLRVIGVTRPETERLLVAEAIGFGLAGSAIGIVAGLAVAALALRWLGGDLGGGYFAGVRPALVVDAGQTVAFFLLGVAAAGLGGWLPARAIARAEPAPLLKAAIGIESARRSPPWFVLGLIVLAGVLLTLPAVGGVPMAAYLAIAALLVAAIGLKPYLAPLLLIPLARWTDRWRHPRAAVWLAFQRLGAMPRFAAIGAAGIVASFALMVAMATMVTSFRASVDAWLARVLPADIYARAGPTTSATGNTTAFFSEADQRRILDDPQVARVEFSRHLKLILDPARAPVTLLARTVDRLQPAKTLPLTGTSRPWQPSMPPPAWVSEAIVDIYGARVGHEFVLPLAGKDHRFFIAGVWRDYARQGGSVVIDSADYQRLTGDLQRTDAALWLASGANAANVVESLRSSLQAGSAEFAETGEVRAASLRIFDRSFAVTYLLEIAAIVIGLTGIAATFATQAIARRREFGMLRHLGVTRGEILQLLALEGLVVTGLAILLGLASGIAVAWILVDIVNPQSFHWTMDLLLPWSQITALIVALLAAACATAVIAGRRAVAHDAVLAVREDW
jgi:putative ABC transport system permease protein